MRFNKIQDSVIIGMANLIEGWDGSTGKHVKNTQTQKKKEFIWRCRYGK